jgi:hypothetical protein
MPAPASSDPNTAIRDHFEAQAQASERIGSPFVAGLCRLLAARLDESTAFGRAILAWQGDPRADALSLRACGALHWLVRSGKAPALARLYPPAPFDAEALWAELARAIPRHDEELTAFLDSAPQTNEVARSALILGAALHIAARTRLPLDIYEIGASAGLNQAFDEYRYELGNGVTWGRPDAPVVVRSDWRGNLPPIDAPLTVAARAGCDRLPVDPASGAGAERLLSYVWPDQPARLERTAAALRHAARMGRRIDAVDAGAWVDAVLARPPRPGTCRVLLHTIVWQYMPPATQQQIEAALAKAAAGATDETPLAHFAFEPDHTALDGRMTLTVWPGGTPVVLGRGHFHGAYAEWA